MYSIFHKKIMLKPPYIYIYARLHGSGSRGRDYGCRFGSSRSRGCTGAHKLNHGPVRVVACGITEVRQKCTCVSQETLLRDKIAICGNIDHCYNKVKVSTQFLAMVAFTQGRMILWSLGKAILWFKVKQASHQNALVGWKGKFRAEHEREAFKQDGFTKKTLTFTLKKKKTHVAGLFYYSMFCI
jgi:hypothetical protein